MENKGKTTPYPMRLTDDEIKKLDVLKSRMGLSNRVQVVKHLIELAYVVRRPSVRIREKDKVTA